MDMNNKDIGHLSGMALAFLFQRLSTISERDKIVWG